MIREISYQGAPALELTSGEAAVVLPLGYGPRVISATLRGGPNLFAQSPAGNPETGWKIYGGHRLWHAPEHPVRTYSPDNTPPERIETTATGRAVQLAQTEEANTGIGKLLEVEALGGNAFRVSHSLTNHGLWEIELAAWALTVCAHGGYSVIPLPAKGQHPTHLLPSYHLVPWDYTDFALPCWQFHRDFIGIDVRHSRTPQKLGLANHPGWAAYWQEGGTFVKDAPVLRDARYPDGGCAYETFHCDWMVELETLSPLVRLAPGASVTHVEHWLFLPDLAKPDNAEAYAALVAAKGQAWVAGLHA